MVSERFEKKTLQSDRITPEAYVLMNEHEKDAEIERAVVRLQKRIQEILYALEIEKPRC